MDGSVMLCSHVIEKSHYACELPKCYIFLPISLNNGRAWIKCKYLCLQMSPKLEYWKTKFCHSFPPRPGIGPAWNVRSTRVTPPRVARLHAWVTRVHPHTWSQTHKPINTKPASAFKTTAQVTVRLLIDLRQQNPFRSSLHFQGKKQWTLWKLLSPTSKQHLSLLPISS